MESQDWKTTVYFDFIKKRDKDMEFREVMKKHFKKSMTRNIEAIDYDFRMWNWIKMLWNL